MPWKQAEKLSKQSYPSEAEKSAFRRGYSDGFHLYSFGRNRQAENKWVNAYSRGYNEGKGDKEDDSGVRQTNTDTRGHV